MDEVTKIVPPPVLFNLWKHHLGFIINEIRKAQKNDTEALRDQLKKLGNNQLDLYVGQLNQERLAEEVLYYLQKNNVLAEAAFASWLNQSHQQYQLVTLSDSSFWTLRKGQQQNRYVHIHPGRYAPFTARVRAVTLKTSIIATNAALRENRKLTLADINFLRKEILGESPITHLQKHVGLGKMIRMMEDYVGVKVLEEG